MVFRCGVAVLDKGTTLACALRLDPADRRKPAAAPRGGTAGPIHINPENISPAGTFPARPSHMNQYSLLYKVPPQVRFPKPDRCLSRPYSGRVFFVGLAAPAIWISVTRPQDRSSSGLQALPDQDTTMKGHRNRLVQWQRKPVRFCLFLQRKPFALLTGTA